MITADQIKRFAPSAMPGVIAAITAHPDAIEIAGLTKPLRIQHFMAQIAVESMGLTRLEENLSYSAKRLTQVWPKRFPSIASATGYAYNPRALAEKVYGGRLGNTHPGDGWTYRGSGLMQTTGRSNFAAAGHESDPDTLRQPVGALLSALKFWTDHACNAIADTDNLTRLRITINGGTNGIDDAKIWLAKAKKVFA